MCNHYRLGRADRGWGRKKRKGKSRWRRKCGRRSKEGTTRIRVKRQDESWAEKEEKKGERGGECRREKRWRERWGGRRNRRRRGWKQRRAVCDIYCFSNWKGKLVLFCSGAHTVLRNRKPEDLPILADSWCPPIAVPPFLLATHNGSHPDPGQSYPILLTILHAVCIHAWAFHYKCTPNYRWYHIKGAVFLCRV